mmetsp:Transcript_121934/g.356325  ORF Transcript_121934/g.356325 Transcript_121934/m.356325 type:complete len:146 (+) Transcript_121934:125-562(+)
MKFLSACCISYFAAFAHAVNDAVCLLQQSPAKDPVQDKSKATDPAKDSWKSLPLEMTDRMLKMGDEVGESWRKMRKEAVENWEHKERKRYRTEVAMKKASADQKAQRKAERKARKAEDAAKFEERKVEREEQMRQLERESESKVL